MAEREVILGTHLYRDAKGIQRTANRGEVVDFTDEEVERGEALEAIAPVGTLAEIAAEPGADGDLSGLSDAELAEWVEGHTVNEVVEHAGTTEMAQRLLDAEQAREKGDPRKGVLDGVAAAIAKLNE